MAFFLRLAASSVGLSLSSFFSRAERPILISIMTRNGCWRECSSLSVAPVPVVYLSGTRIAPFHPGEKHGEAETAVSRLFFYVQVASSCRSLRPCPLPTLSCPNLYAWQNAFSRIKLNHSVLRNARTVCTCV